MFYIRKLDSWDAISIDIMCFTWYLVHYCLKWVSHYLSRRQGLSLYFDFFVHQPQCYLSSFPNQLECVLMLCLLISHSYGNFDFFQFSIPEFTTANSGRKTEKSGAEQQKGENGMLLDVNIRLDQKSIC